MGAVRMMGHYLEPMAAQLFADLTDNYVDKESEGDWLAGAVKMALREAGELVDMKGNTLATWKAGKDGIRRLRIVGKKPDV